MTYLHAGMVQHDPSGNPAFLHRTAEGKVYPFNHGYRKVRLWNLSAAHLGAAVEDCSQAQPELVQHQTIAP